jgi:hypothetical protein
MGKMVFGAEKVLKFALMIANPVKKCSPAVGFHSRGSKFSLLVIFTPAFKILPISS